MNKRTLTALAATTLCAASVWAGPYSGPTGGGAATDQPVAGFVGPEGDGFVGGENYLNPVFKGWATYVVKDSYRPAPGLDAAWTNTDMALGPIYKANPALNSSIKSLEYAIVSLGDLSAQQIADGVKPGTITLGFNMKITNGDGYDFVVFENALSNGDNAFLELAYVEVSTDGVHFARFQNTSLNGPEPDDTSGMAPEAELAYGYRDATNVHNLAGKHQNSRDESWGTGFDLNDLLLNPWVQNQLVDLNNINYIRLVDIPGNGMFEDSNGNPIYDAWETISSGGFDLAGIGVINGVQVPEPALSTIALLLSAGCIALVSRRRRKAINLH